MAQRKNLKDGYQQAIRETGVREETRIAVQIEGDTGIAWLSFGPITVPAGQTIVVDTNLLTSFSRLDYIINFKDDPVTVTKSLRLIVQNNAGSLTEVVTQRLGGSIDLVLDVTDDSIDAFTRVTNNEAFDINVTFLRAITA